MFFEEVESSGLDKLGRRGAGHRGVTPHSAHSRAATVPRPQQCPVFRGRKHRALGFPFLVSQRSGQECGGLGVGRGRGSLRTLSHLCDPPNAPRALLKQSDRGGAEHRRAAWRDKGHCQQLAGSGGWSAEQQEVVWSQRQGPASLTGALHRGDICPNSRVPQKEKCCFPGFPMGTVQIAGFS